VDRWRTLEQLHRWNRPDAFYRIFVFVVVVWAALGTRTQSALRLLAWLALSQRTTLFFFHTSRCYAFLAWALTFLVSVNNLWPLLHRKRVPPDPVARPANGCAGARALRILNTNGSIMLWRMQRRLC